MFRVAESSFIGSRNFVKRSVQFMAVHELMQ